MGGGQGWTADSDYTGRKKGIQVLYDIPLPAIKREKISMGI